MEKYKIIFKVSYKTRGGDTYWQTYENEGENTYEDTLYKELGWDYSGFRQVKHGLDENGKEYGIFKKFSTFPPVIAPTGERFVGREEEMTIKL